MHMVRPGLGLVEELLFVSPLLFLMQLLQPLLLLFRLHRLQCLCVGFVLPPLGSPDHRLVVRLEHKELQFGCEHWGNHISSAPRCECVFEHVCVWTSCMDMSCVQAMIWGLTCMVMISSTWRVARIHSVSAHRYIHAPDMVYDVWYLIYGIAPLSIRSYVASHHLNMNMTRTHTLVVMAKRHEPLS